MSKSTNLTRKWLLTGTILTTLAVGLPVLAQEATPPADGSTATPAAPKTAPVEDATTEIVVTGSRIRKSEFNSAAPVQIITSERSSLSGMISAADVLQSSSIAAGAGQINNTFTGYVVDGGDGVNTLSLRGLGAQRSLILINGRRMPPAGVSGTVGAVDLNFIPQSLVSRYEILTDGASSIYGSDAVAGVVNVITTKNYDGLHLEASGLKSEKSGADSYSASAMWGKSFDKGNILISGEYYEQKPLYLSDRPGLACPQDYYYNADGTRADRIDPNTGKYSCYNANGLAQNVVIDAFTGRYYRSKPGSVTTVGIPGIPDFESVTSNSQIDFDPQEALDATAFSPVKRGFLFAQGNYRPDWLGGAELYTELMWGRRESSQSQYAEIFPYYSDFASVNPFPTIAQPIALHKFTASQKVDFTRLLGGVRGNLGNWNWDAYVSHSKSDGTYSGTAIYADRVNWGTGFDQVNFDYMDQTTGDVCGAGAPAGCIPLNLFTNDALTKAKLTPEEEAWFFTQDVGKTIYEQTIAEATITGDLYQLPAGPLGAAFGVSFREDKIDDLPGELSRSGNSYNQSSAGETKGTDHLSEIFYELEAPVVRGKPFFEDLTLNFSGRYSNYESVGGSGTYKVGFNWAVDNIFRVRGTAGTSFRAPALYELYLNDQTGYLNQLGLDPCIRYDDTDAVTGRPKVSPTIKANCLADGVPGDYDGANPSAVITTHGGSDLKPETSYATTLGFVLTPPNTGFKLAIDFWKIKIADQISSSGAAVVGACYASVDFRSKPGFCDQFVRDMDSTSPTYHSILTIDGSYRNIPTEASAGVDFTVNYEHEFNFGKLSSDAKFTYYKYDKIQLYPDSIIDNYTGLIGQQHWAGDVQTRFTHKDWTLAWTFNYIGNASNIGFRNESGNTGGNVSYAPDASYAASVPPFVTHDLELRYRAKTFEVIAGVNNIFDKYAPIIGSGVYAGSASRFGNYPFGSQYSTGIIGRQFYLNVSKDF